MQESGGPPNPGAVFDMLSAFQQTAALETAIDLDVFHAIAQGQGDLASIAKQCGASERGMRILCDFLVIHGMLQKVDGRYRNTPTSAVFLDSASPAYLGTVAKFINGTEVYDAFENLTEIVRTGRTTLAGAGTMLPDNPLWVTFAENMAPLTGTMAKPLSERVLAHLNGPLRVLDIAAGHGLFGIELAKADAGTHVTALDWASVLEIAQRNAAKAGVADRYRLLPGSAFEVEFGGPYDVVLLTNFLHHFDKAECVALLTKVHAALRPGGLAVTMDFVPDECRTKPAPSASFAMNMLTSTVAGDAYTLSELHAMYAAAGFSGMTGEAIPMSPATVVMGRA